MKESPFVLPFFLVSRLEDNSFRNADLELLCLRRVVLGCLSSRRVPSHRCCISSSGEVTEEDEECASLYIHGHYLYLSSLWPPTWPPTSASISFFFFRALVTSALTARIRAALKLVVVNQSSRAFAKHPLCILHYVIKDYNVISQFLLCRRSPLLPCYCILAFLCTDCLDPLTQPSIYRVRQEENMFSACKFISIIHFRGLNNNSVFLFETHVALV